MKNRINMTILAACLITAVNLTQAKAIEAFDETPAAVLTQPERGTAAQRQWLKASPEERIRLAQAIGEKGARNWARAKGWQPLLDSGKKTLPQGPDMVYRGNDGIIHVIEAKGGSGQLGHAYGYPQGSSEWAVKSGERILNCPTASKIENKAAQDLLTAAVEGRLQVHVVRTPHVLGNPKLPVLEQTVECSAKASQLASAIRNTIAPAKSLPRAGETEEGVARSLAGRSAAEAAESSIGDAARSTTKGLGGVAKAAGVAGFGVDLALRAGEAESVERSYAAGQISSSERIEAHARNAGGMAGGWGGAAAAGNLGAEGGAAVGTAICPGVGTLIGGIVGGIGGGILGYIAGEWVGENAAGTVAGCVSD